MNKVFLFVLSAIIVVISEFIGIIKIPIGIGSIILLPLLYSVVLGILLSSPFIRKSVSFFNKYLTEKDISYAGKVLSIVMLPLGIKLGLMVGARFEEILQSGPAFILAQIGHIAPIMFGLPIAFMLALKEEGIGSSVSIGREPTLGVMMDQFSGESKEVFGTLSIYMVGTIFGTIIFSILGSLGPLTGLHPFALAIGTGVGSASMMTSGIASLTEQVQDPAIKDKILALGVTANLLSTLTEAYIVTFVTLPMAKYFYRKKYKEKLK